MSKNTKFTIISIALGLILSIPISIFKVNASHQDVSESNEVETITEECSAAFVQYLEPIRNFSFIQWELPTQKAETEPETEIETTTEEPTEPEFTGYDFIPFDSEFQLEILNICNEYNICFDLVLAMIRTETRFQWLIGDHGNSIGYMQIQPRWWQKTADAHGLNISDPLDNINLGIIILNKGLNDNNGDLIKALKQYNSGNPNSKSNAYVERIIQNFEWIATQKGEAIETCIEGRCGNEMRRSQNIQGNLD